VNKVDRSGRLCCDQEECQADAEGRSSAKRDELPDLHHVLHLQLF